MGKGDEEIPTLGVEGIEELEEESEEVEEEAEELKETAKDEKVLLVTNEQLIQSKLDNLGILVQNIVTQINSLIEVLRKRK